MKRLLFLAVPLIAVMTAGQEKQEEGSVSTLRRSNNVAPMRQFGREGITLRPLFLSSWRAPQEMSDCMNVDPVQNGATQFFKYGNVNVGVAVEYNKRLLDFLDRHKLRPQFQVEDKAGKR